MAINRRRNWGSTAQKIALKRAQEISARKRRGTGKLKPTAKDYRAQGDKSISARRAPLTFGSTGYQGMRTRRGNPRRSPTDRAAGVRRGAGSNDPVGESLKGRIKAQKEKFTAYKRQQDAKKAQTLESKAASKSGPSNSITTKTGTHKVGDAVNIGTGGQVWRILSIEGDNVTVRGELQLNANSKQTRVFKADRISYNQSKNSPDRWPNKVPDNPKSSNAQRQSELARKAGMSVAEYKKKLANDSRKITKATKDQNQGKTLSKKPTNLKQTPGGSKSAMGTADPATMSVSAIVKERKELNAKKNSTGLSKEESARLVAIQAESSLRTKNRKEGKGAGPTKVSMAKKEPAKKKEILSSKGVEREWDSVYNVYAKIHNTGRAAKITVGKDGKIEIDFSNTNMAGNTLRPTSIMNALEKAGYRNTRLEGDKILAEVASSGDGSGPNVRNPFKGSKSLPKDLKGREVNDKTDLTDLPDKDFNKIDDIRMEMSDVALDFLNRDNLVEEIDKAETVGDMIDAMQSVFWYLDEQAARGRVTPQYSKIYDKMSTMFEELKKYSDRWPRG